MKNGDAKVPLVAEELKPRPNARSEAGQFSKRFFIYLDSFFSVGWDRDLTEDDITAPQIKARSENLAKRLEKEWTRQLASEKPSLGWAIFRTFLPELLGKHAAAIWTSEFLRFFQCFVMYWLIQSFAKSDFNMAYVWALLFGMCSILWTLVYHPSFIYYQRSGAFVRISVCSLMFRKVLKLSHPSLQKTSRGQIINLMSNDVMRYDLIFLFINHLIIGPLQCCFTIYFLWSDYGYSSLGGIGVVSGLAVLQSFQSRIFYKLRMMTAKRTDARIKIVDEMINAMKAIKVYCWESYFGKIIEKARKSEMYSIWLAQLLRGFFVSFFVSGPKLVTFASFTIFIATSSVSLFNPGKVFFMIAILNVTRLSCSIFLPLEMMFLSEAYGATKRIEEFLLLGERQNTIQNRNNNSKTDSIVRLLGSVELTEMSASWNGTVDVLNTVSLQLGPGQLLVITGPVGSGKSSFLTSLLDELVVRSGNLSLSGTVSFCPQEAWIFVGTIRENILFGSPFEPERYARVVDAAALNRDFELFPHGDESLVGDKGVTLSGGQKARVNFARAIYRRADIYLLDDPFSAVDPKVGKKLAHSVQTFLKGKTRVVVTHQEHYLPGHDKLLQIEAGAVLSVSSQESAAIFDLPEPTDIFEDFLPQSREKPGNDFKETSQTGTIGFGLIKRYMSLKYPFYVFVLYLILEVSSMVFIFFSDVWLKFWLEDVAQFGFHCLNSSVLNGTDCNPPLMELENSVYYRNVYIGLSILTPFLIASVKAAFMRMMVKTNGELHDHMTKGIMGAPIHFFERTTPGVIMNRFSKDLGQVDEMLPQVMSDAINIFISCILILLIAAYTNFFTIFLSLPLLYLFMRIRVYYIKSARQLKRLEGALRSPVFGTLTSTVNGLVVIRAFKAESKVQKEFDERQDRHTGAWMLFLETGRWLGFRLDIINAIYITIVALFFPLLASYSNVDPGGIGLSLTMVVGLLGMLQWGVRQSTETETLLTSVERLMEYKDIPSETKSGKSLSDWPKRGGISMKSMSFSYNGTDDVLKEINLEISDGEKIGIVGRTGAGKSSLTTTLFRLRELRKGKIVIDEEDTREIGLFSLRRGITLIPQEPIIFASTIRSNLDPLGNHSDAALWNALETVQMKKAIEKLENKLEFKLPSGGNNFSIGERQLLCMGRALLMKTKILLIDEATANVDPETDEIIQNIIRTEFADSTTLTIAHRINTIIDSDRILVLDHGTVRELDSPKALLSDPNSYFSSMVDETNISEELRRRVFSE